MDRARVNLRMVRRPSLAFRACTARGGPMRTFCHRIATGFPFSSSVPRVKPTRFRGIARYPLVLMLEPLFRGVEGMMIAPGYNYAKAPDQDHFQQREQTKRLFFRLLPNPKQRRTFTPSPFFRVSARHTRSRLHPVGHAQPQLFWPAAPVLFAGRRLHEHRARTARPMPAVSDLFELQL